MFRLALLIVLQFAALRGLQWTQRFQDNSRTMEVCSGHSIQLLWNYTLQRGENVKDVVWTCQPEDQGAELLASYVDNNFLPAAQFSGRLSHLKDVGIELSCATIMESGNYSVAVRTVDNSGTETLHRQTAWVKVVDPPKTQSGRLEVGQDRTAVPDEVSDGGTTGQWHTPDGQTLSSSYFRQGSFHLLLANPVRGGNYTCRLPSLSPPSSCLPADSPMRDDVNVFVEEVAGRVAVMEAGQRQVLDGVQREMERLGHVIAELRNETQTLRLAASRQVSFHARLSSTLLGEGVLKPFTVISSQGSPHAFNASSGVFTAPINGTYFFAASAGTYNRSTFIDMRLEVDGEAVSRAITGQYLESHWTMGSVQATLHLQEERGVWLRCYHPQGYYRDQTTSFTGFLVHADAM